MKKYLRLGNQAFETEVGDAIIGGVEGATEIGENEHKALKQAEKDRNDSLQRSADEMAAQEKKQHAERRNQARKELLGLGLSPDVVNLLLND